MAGEERVEERGWAYRRRQPEGTVLYEAVKDNLATLLAEASEVGRGLPRYVERDCARYCALPAVDAVLSASGAVGAAQGRGAPLGLPTASAHLAPERGPPQGAWC
ncbi:hypothetical protein DAT35_52645 [Vitiosangium sp. GDMCC 1.1324]|nr:hypothetical protein DAT35_52645 [Vitiosangium sp. GDMCC 1.1324]